MNICGILVHAKPEKSELVRSHLLELPGVEVHAVNDDGRIVVTIEEDNEMRMGETLNEVQTLKDAVSATLIYHHCEDDNELLAEEAE